VNQGRRDLVSRYSPARGVCGGLLALAASIVGIGSGHAQDAAPQPQPAPATAPPVASSVPPVPVPLPPLTPADGAAIAAAIAEAAGEGIPVEDISGPVKALGSRDAATREAAEAAVASAAVALARAERGMRIDPHEVSNDWPSPPLYDPDADFAAARVDGRVPAWAAGLTREDPDYNALVAARARYAAAVAKGGWARISADAPPRVYQKSVRAAALAGRVASEGYADLADFQTHHGLNPDGALTPQTLEALNVSAEDRLATIDANLERARWFIDPLPSERIEADIAGTTVDLFVNGKSMLPMRAVAGDATHHTPMLSSKISSIVFNPPWVVPASIAKAESYPKERAHPGYFARNGFRIIDGQLVQMPGPKTALGYIKFDFPNAYSVYLHDTPSRTFFAREERHLSHGCVRVEQPRFLAWALLSPQDMNLQDVDALIAARATKRVGLEVKVPVFLIYRTAVAESGGPVTFRPDVYGWDARLIAALNGAVLPTEQRPAEPPS
jgi:L,D-transpeptidase YcbB